jgi:hypothetical protein
VKIAISSRVLHVRMNLRHKCGMDLTAASLLPGYSIRHFVEVALVVRRYLKLVGSDQDSGVGLAR